MTAPATAPADRALHEVIDDLDDCLVQIGEAAGILIEEVAVARIEPALHARLTFFAKAIEAFVHAARVCGNETTDIATNLSATLRG